MREAFSLLIIIIIFGCSSSKRVVTTKSNSKLLVNKEKLNVDNEKIVDVKSNKLNDKKNNLNVRSFDSNDKIDVYISQYYLIAQKEMQRSGVPASITLAQGILESGAGQGDLTKRANNHFGIKCHDWNGERVFHDDDKRGECFRKYKNPETSFKDHSDFLTSRVRYSFLFELEKTDYKSWAKGLKQAGYATDHRYPSKLISLIERYELYDFDSGDIYKVSISEINEDFEQNQFHIVKKGETLYSISRIYNISVKDIMELNDLNDSSIKIGQKLNLKK